MHNWTCATQTSKTFIAKANVHQEPVIRLRAVLIKYELEEIALTANKSQNEVDIEEEDRRGLKLGLRSASPSVAQTLDARTSILLSYAHLPL